MTFEIQVLDWDRHENVAVLNRLIDKVIVRFVDIGRIVDHHCKTPFA
jgi:hypothetical protein